MDRMRWELSLCTLMGVIGLLRFGYKSEGSYFRLAMDPPIIVTNIHSRCIAPSSHRCDYNSQPPKYVIDQARKRHVNESLSIESVEILAIGHPAFQKITNQCRPRPSWESLHFPDISIAGLQKAGTSQLYNILKSHPNISTFHPQNKEFGFQIKHLSLHPDKMLLKLNGTRPSKAIFDLQRDFFQCNVRFPKFLNVEKKNANQSLTVNACLDTITTMTMRQYLGRTNSSKIIFLLRDPADWLWASYNFWIHPRFHDRKQAVKSDWASRPSQYRSPELFHEMMRAGDRFGPSSELIEKMRNRISNLFSRVIAASKRDNPDNILVLKTEDMVPNRILTSGFLEKLAMFIGVTTDGFNPAVYGTFSNCGDVRGVRSKCQSASSSYAIAGNKSMLEESRDLVYLYFAEECQLWAKEFGIFYERCLAVAEEYGSLILL